MGNKVNKAKSGLNDERAIQRSQLGKQELQQFLFESAEALIQQKVSDAAMDREKEKILLVGGKTIDLSEMRRNLDSLFTENPSTYEKRFPQLFYDEIYRLNNWKVPKNKTLRKHIVGRFTNEIIYMRFTREGLSKLQLLNPYGKNYVRVFKHFQFLSADASVLLEKFIYEAIECMGDCSTWYEFRIKYAAKYNLNVQMRLFEEKVNQLVMES